MEQQIISLCNRATLAYPQSFGKSFLSAQALPAVVPVPPQPLKAQPTKIEQRIGKLQLVLILLNRA